MEERIRQVCGVELTDAKNEAEHDEPQFHRSHIEAFANMYNRKKKPVFMSTFNFVSTNFLTHGAAIVDAYNNGIERQPVLDSVHYGESQVRELRQQQSDVMHVYYAYEPSQKRVRAAVERLTEFPYAVASENAIVNIGAWMLAQVNASTVHVLLHTSGIYEGQEVFFDLDTHVKVTPNSETVLAPFYASAISLIKGDENDLMP